MSPIRLAAIVAVAALSGTSLAMAQRMGSGKEHETGDPLVTAASRWDANHDGTYTCDEWKQYAARIFTLADKNSDGFLNKEEFKHLGKFEPIFADADMDDFDENHDGRVSRQEFVNKPNPFFLRFDANGDCKVTPEELKGSNAGKEKSPANGLPRGGMGHF